MASVRRPRTLAARTTRRLCRPDTDREVAVARDMPGPSVGSSPGEHGDAAGPGDAHSVGADEPPGTVAAPPPPIAGTEAPEPSREAGKHRKLLYATLPGCWG